LVRGVWCEDVYGVLRCVLAVGWGWCNDFGVSEQDLQSPVSGLDMEEGVVFFAFAEEEVFLEEEV
jgi:hypothetical protein